MTSYTLDDLIRERNISPEKMEAARNRIDEFIDALEAYLVWYRDERIKTEYGMSIRRQRQALGLMA